MEHMIVQSGHRQMGPVTRPGVIPAALRTPGPEGLLAVLGRQGWIFLGTLAVALLAGALYLVHATPLFESTSRICVEQSGPRIIRDTDEGVMTRSLNYLYTQAQLVTAMPILTDAVGRLDAGRMSSFKGAADPVGFLKRHLDVTVGRKDDILSVSFKSPDPAEAAQVVNAVVEAYIAFQESHKRSTCLEVLNSLKKEKEASAADLSEKLRVLTEFKATHEELAFQSDRGNVLIEGAVQLSMALGDARLVTLDRKADYETAKAMAGDPVQFRRFIEARQPAAVGRSGSEGDALRLRLRELQLRKAEGLRKLTEDHPEVKAVTAEIAEVQGMIEQDDQRFVQAHLAAMEQQYRVAAEKESQLSLQHSELRQQVIRLSQQAAQCALLQSEYEQSKRLCEALDDRIKELNVTEDIGALNITILEEARAGTSPAEPRKSRVMALALVLGLMAGGGLAFLRDGLDPRPRHPEAEVTGLLGTPLLGVIPAMSRKRTAEQRAQEVALESASHAADCFRTIRTAVFSSIPWDQARTLQVSSPGRSEGKSTVVSNLGIAMAQTGRRVLIVDADLRCPRQHVLFGLAPEPGLTSVLSGTGRLRETIQHTSTPGLDVLTCGPDTSTPAEVLDSRAFRILLEKLKTRYHRILVDYPPIGLVADASILAAACDATLLVVHAGKSTRRGLLQAREALVGVRGRVIGGVINGVPFRRNGTSYGYGSYGQGRGAGTGGQRAAARKVMLPSAAAGLNSGTQRDEPSLRLTRRTAS
jgi:succinoglycan biosynthesis transport protein ExoP